MLNGLFKGWSTSGEVRVTSEEVQASKTVARGFIPSPQMYAYRLKKQHQDQAIKHEGHWSSCRDGDLAAPSTFSTAVIGLSSKAFVE